MPSFGVWNEFRKKFGDVGVLVGVGGSPAWVKLEITSVSALAITENLQLNCTLVANMYLLLLASISSPAQAVERLVGYPPPGPKATIRTEYAMIRSAKFDMRPYLCCGSSKLIAKHSRVVNVVVGKANCGYAEIGSGKRSARRSGIETRVSRAELGGGESVVLSRGLVYQR